jgi:hypothetical protein
MTNEKQYVTWYRTGGTANFEWRLVLAVYDLEGARKSAAHLIRMGYRAHFGAKSEMDAVGLPQTFNGLDYFRKTTAAQLDRLKAR